MSYSDMIILFVLNTVLSIAFSAVCMQVFDCEGQYTYQTLPAKPCIKSVVSIM